MTSIEKINYQLTLHGMSGAELCRGIGLSNGIYSQWNKNRVIPSNKTLGKIANFLNIPVESILPDEETQPPETERLRNTISEILNGLTNDEVKVLNAYRQIDSEKRPVYLEILQQAGSHKE